MPRSDMHIVMILKKCVMQIVLIQYWIRLTVKSGDSIRISKRGGDEEIVPRYSLVRELVLLHLGAFSTINVDFEVFLAIYDVRF